MVAFPWKYSFYAPDRLFLSRVCLLSTLTFTRTLESLEIKIYRDFIYCMHFPILKLFQNDTKVNDSMTLTMTFMLQIAFFFYFVAAGGIVFLKHILFDSVIAWSILFYEQL